MTGKSWVPPLQTLLLRRHSALVPASIVCWTHCKVIYLGWHWLGLMLGFLNFDTSLRLTSLGDWMGVKCLHCQPTWSYAVLFYGFIENVSESRGQPISLPTKGERRNYLLVINTESGQISREKWHLVFLRTKFLSSRSEFWMTTWDRFCSPSFPLSPFFLAMSESNACKSSYVQCVRCRAASTISESRAKVSLLRLTTWGRRTASTAATTSTEATEAAAMGGPPGSGSETTLW